MEILSYGGGIQTAALAVLNVTGRVTPRAEYAVFSDPGAEMPGTYAHIEIMRPWLARRGLELVTVTNERDGDLETYVRERSTVIPVRLANGIGHRQCTVRWKMEPIQNWLKSKDVEEATVQLGISWDESQRMHDNKSPLITNRWPLVELRLTRQDCVNILRDAGLPVPPKSACYFCPFHRHAAWQNLAVYEPELFDRAADLEDVINTRKDSKAVGRVYLSSKLRPLRQSFSKDQLPLPGFDDDDDGCAGYCFV